MSIADISFLLFLLPLFFQLSHANDTINTSRTISENQTLVSSGGRFELGFFTPGNSKNWYVGIWYKNITRKSVIWVANREIPLKNSKSALLKFTQTGFLVILDEENNPVWFSNNSGPAKNPVAQLLDTGNLVLREENDNSYLWQSFDYPTDTYLPGMDLGPNYVTGREYHLTSWKNDEDPALGEFSMHLDPEGYPQILIKRLGITQYRVGPWDGVSFSGDPLRRVDTADFKFLINKNGVYYSWQANFSSEISKFILNPNGLGQRTTWVDQTQEWVPHVNIPKDTCDHYGLCGVYGSCNILYFPVCGCLDRFEPKNPEGWARADWTNGCVRKKPLNCESGITDGFLKYSGIKLPDARNTWYNESMTLEECKMECLKNCNCTAYTNIDIRNEGSGCLIWLEELVDIRVTFVGGHEIYIRMASSELGKN